MNPEAESILEQCLVQLAAGEATVQDCLTAHPNLAGELGPMLLAAERLRSLPKPSLAPGAKARLEAQVLEHFDARVLPARAARRPTWRWVPVGLGAAVVLAILVLALVGLSTSALPGSPLYAVKRAAEEFRLWAAPADAEAGLRLRFAQRRLDEIEALAQRGAVDVALLEALVRETEGVLAAAEALPAVQAVPALEGLVELSARISQTMTGLLARDASLSRARVLAVIAALDAQAAQAGALLSSLREELPPLPTQTPTPTSTAAAGEPAQPTSTDTPRPPSTASATPTGTATATPSASELMPPASTSTPEAGATSRAADTPTPTKKTPPGHTYTPAPGQTKKVTPTETAKPDKSDKSDNRGGK